MRAIQVSRFGGPEVLELVELPAPAAGPDLVRIRVDSAGVDYADTHQAADDYLAPQRVPFVPGSEVVGRDDEGRRVVALVSGGYAEQAVARPPAARPWSCTRVREVSAAWPCSWRARRGRLGSSRPRRRPTSATDDSLSALAPFGRLVTYGMASRKQAEPVDPSRLMARSQAVVGFWLVHALGVPGGLRPAVAERLDLHTTGRLRVLNGGAYPLEHARQAHEDMRARRTHGKLTLTCTPGP